MNKLDKKKKKVKELTQDMVPRGWKDSDEEKKGWKKEGGYVNLVFAH